MVLVRMFLQHSEMLYWENKLDRGFRELTIVIRIGQRKHRLA